MHKMLNYTTVIIAIAGILIAAYGAMLRDDGKIAGGVMLLLVGGLLWGALQVKRIV